MDLRALRTPLLASSLALAAASSALLPLKPVLCAITGALQATPAPAPARDVPVATIGTRG